MNILQKRVFQRKGAEDSLELAISFLQQKKASTPIEVARPNVILLKLSVHFMKLK